VSGRTSRRRVLRASAGLAAAAGLAGCSGGGGAETDTEAEDTATTTPSGTVSLELPDGSTRCIDPIEGDGPVADYYAFDADDNRSANVPEELMENDATVTFVYRNGSNDALHLVVVHGDPTSEAAAEGAAPMSFEGVDGAEWQVQDGPPSAVPYTTPEGSFDGPETALWSWPADRTDGGALGPLGDGFDVTVTHLQSGTVDGSTVERTGVDRWLFVDGNATGQPIEVASFEDGEDVSVGVSAGCQ